jgi:Uncharacterized conserved protein
VVVKLLGAGHMKTYQGSCHFGRIRFEVDADLDHVRACDCSVCQRHGALSHRVSKDNLRLLSSWSDLATGQERPRLEEAPRCLRGWPEARHVKMVVLQESRDYWLLCGLREQRGYRTESWVSTSVAPPYLPSRSIDDRTMPTQLSCNSGP